MPAAETTRRLTAILSADAVGYSRLMAADEAATVAAIVQHRSTIAKLAGEHGGRVVDYFIELSTEFIRRQVELGLSSVKDPNRLAHALVQMNHAVFYDNLMREASDKPAAVARVIADIWNGSIYGRTR